MSSNASCEESSVREGAGYDEAFGFGNESEDFSPSLEREMSAQSPDGDESYTEGVNEVEEGRGQDGGEGGDIDIDDDDCDGGDMIFVSEGTLKWHLHNVYGKLNVKNRSGAMTRARALGIL